MSTDALRAVRALIPDAEPVQDESPDEGFSGSYADEPRLVRAESVEGSTFRAIRVVGDPVVGFAGFLDGIQRVSVISHVRGVPIVLGGVAAVIRVRRNRRFVTWGHAPPLVHWNLYIPLAHVAVRSDADTGKFGIVDTSYATEKKTLISRHPAAMRAVAFECVANDRANVEIALAERWCADMSEPLFIDGGVSGSARIASASCAVGVVKSHRTLYADGDALEVVMSLTARRAKLGVQDRLRHSLECRELVL